MEIFIAMYGHTAHLYIVEYSTVKYSPAVEEESSHLSVECDVPRELLLHTDKLMLCLEIGLEMFEENELDSVTISENRNSSRKCRSTFDTMSVWK